MLPPKRLRVRREKLDIEIDMKEAHLWVLDQQENIARAKRAGDLGLAESIALEIVSSEYGRAIAIQTVASNIGARSPGLSTESFVTNDDYMEMMGTLDRIVSFPKEYKATPLDRIYIPKKDGKLRPLSIPSYTDRCLQALYKLALEPYSEEVADLSSYGFRPIRGVSWAVGRTLNAIANPLTKYSFCVEVDIAGCFDNISHEFLSQIVPFIPKHILWEWLTCGYVTRDEKDVIQETKTGAPQGGILSPLLANLTLDGLEDHIRKRILEANTGSKGSCFCRYADDMVVLVTTYKNALVALEAIKEFLAIRGLQIKEAKTRITNIYEDSFDFLCFNFALIHRHNKKRKVARVGIPASAISKVRAKVKATFRTTKDLHNRIDEVNQIIRGWGYNYRFAHNSVYIFRSLRYAFWKQFYGACYRKTKNRFDKYNHTKIHQYVMDTYFGQYSSYTQWPIIHDFNGSPHILFDISSIKYDAPVYTNSAKNAYILEDREILDKKALATRSNFKNVVLEKWYGCCGLCRKRLDLNYVPYEIHHILPKRFGGSNEPRNLVPLCKAPCHLQVSNAVVTKNYKEILKFMGMGILEIPYNYLAIIAPGTE
jgi:RNA-directed DNA polymerase